MEIMCIKLCYPVYYSQNQDKKQNENYYDRTLIITVLVFQFKTHNGLFKTENKYKITQK